MTTFLTRLARRQHAAVALLASALIISSPWVALLRTIPANAGFVDYAHVVLGLCSLLLSVTYAVGLWRHGGWCTYFPWLAGRSGLVAHELRGLAQGRVPGAESGGLFAAIEGLALLLLLAAAASGAAWLLLQGTQAALVWRDFHVLAARGLLGVIVMHVISVSLHLVELVRD